MIYFRLVVVVVVVVPGWFKPTYLQGQLIDVCGSASGRDLVMMTFFPPAPPKGPTLRFFLWDLEHLQLLDYHIEVPVTGNTPPAFSVTPLLDSAGSDYLYVLMENTVTIYSLATGQQMTGPLRPLTAQDRQNKVLRQILVVGLHAHLCLLGPDISSLYMFAIEDNNDADTRKSVSEGMKPRRYATPAEQRVRALAWDLDDMDPAETIVIIIQDIIDEAFKIAGVTAEHSDDDEHASEMSQASDPSEDEMDGADATEEADVLEHIEEERGGGSAGRGRYDDNGEEGEGEDGMPRGDVAGGEGIDGEGSDSSSGESEGSDGGGSGGGSGEDDGSGGGSSSGDSSDGDSS